MWWVKDGWWSDEKITKALSNCGFTVYESEDFGIVFGIDGCGYDFFDDHWVPLLYELGINIEAWAK